MAKFTKGQSGNPSGRPKDIHGVAEYARSFCIEALDVIRSIYLDVSAKDEVRYKCAQTMIDRGYGPVPRPMLVTPSDADGRIPDVIEHLPSGRVDIEKFAQEKLINR